MSENQSQEQQTSGIAAFRPKPKLCIVVPAFNEADNLPVLVERITKALTGIESWQLLVVDDGSTDSTLEVMRRLAAENSSIKYLSFSRNFGHQAGLKAGLVHADADAEVLVTMDADLQHPPELIPSMLEQWRAGYPVVNMIRRETTRPGLKSLTSRWFYRLLGSISDVKISEGSSDFRLLDKSVLDVLRRLPEQSVFLRGIIPWTGFRHRDIYYEPDARNAGSTKFTLPRMMGLALAGVTSSSIKPLRLSTYLGVITSGAAMVYAIYALFIKFFAGTAVSGWTSLLIGIMLLGGVQLMMLGIIGEYVGQVLAETRGRPRYIVRETNVGELDQPHDSASARRADATE